MARKRVNFKTSGTGGGLKPPTNTKNGGELDNPYVDPRKEYLSGGTLSTGIGLNSNFDFSRTLGGTNDDLMQEFGYSIYSQMSKDPKISKCIKVIKIAALGDGVEIVTSVPDQHPEFDDAKMISDFCSYAVKNMNKPMKQVLEQMLDAIVYGHKIAEIVYKNEYIEEFGGTYLTIASIKPKPIGLARFVVDQSMNVLGIVGNGVNSNTGQISPADKAIIPSRKDTENIKANNIYQKNGRTYVKSEDGTENVFLNLDKFMYLTIDTEDEDPRGRSMLRAAFNFWHLKQQVIPEYLRYLLTCSIPLLIGYTPEIDGGAAYVKNPDGTIKKDSMNRPLQMNQEEALREALMQARNATTLALKGGSKVQEVGANGSGIPFYKAIEIFDNQIEMSILLAPLATSEGRFQARAASETHLSTLEGLIWSIKGSLADMLTKYLLTPLIKYNFGDSYLKYMPAISLGDTERRNFLNDASAIAALYSAGYISEDQKPFTDAILTLPPRNTEYDQLKEITRDEALRYSDAILKQADLESSIKKNREAANLDRIQQVVGLQELLQPKSTGINGKPSKAVSSDVEKIINEFTKSVLDDIRKDTLDEDTARITKTILNIGSRTHQVLSPQNLKLGKIESLDPTITDDSSLKRPESSGPSGQTGSLPYISTKGSSKPTTFSRIKKKILGE